MDIKSAYRKREWKSLAKSKVKKKPISEEEYTTNRVLAVFSICLGGVLLLMTLQRLLNYGYSWKIGSVASLVLTYVGCAGILSGLYLIIRERSGKRESERRILSGRNILIVSVIFTVCMWLVYKYNTLPIKGMYVVLPVLAVYYLVYHSYTPEFFLIALDCGMAIGLMWLIQRALNSDTHKPLAHISVVIAVVLAAVQVAGVLMLRSKKGRYTLKGKKRIARFGKSAYTILVVTPVLMALLTVSVLFIPSRFLILLGIAAAYLFITAVYYTVKLM